MIQVNREVSTQPVYFTSTASLDRTNVRLEFTNLTTDYPTTYLVQAKRAGDWYKCALTLPITLPVGMYLVVVKDETTEDVYARRLGYVSASATEAIETDYDTYNAPTSNIVYDG